MATTKIPCVFCRIANGAEGSHVVFEDDISLAFLDARPLFPGHTLLIPREHVETLTDLPAENSGRFFENTKRLTAAIESTMESQGTFVAINNKVSQSVPHLHVHIVPRRKGDGLRGFFWPRSKYKSAEEMAEVAAKIRKAVSSF